MPEAMWLIKSSFGFFTNPLGGVDVGKLGCFLGYVVPTEKVSVCWRFIISSASVARCAYSTSKICPARHCHFGHVTQNMSLIKALFAEEAADCHQALERWIAFFKAGP